jgi:branched-chain amino acid aminotransferase
MIIWLNGVLADADRTRIDPADRGLTLGDGLFETMMARDGRILRLELHLERLRAGAAIIRLPLPQLPLPEMLTTTLEINKLNNAVLRLTITRGIAGRGILPPEKVKPTVMVTTTPLPSELPPATCIVSAVTRRNEFSPLCRVKSLNYLDNIMARMEATDQGADDALLLNTKGRAAESTVANLFIVKCGEIHTPPLAEGALPGTVRSEVMQMLQVRETCLSVEDIINADEVFLTNSLGVRPVVKLDGHAINQGSVASSLRSLFLI